MEADWNEWRTNATAAPGDNYPVGSVAVLANPQPVDTGISVSGRTVSRFVKRSAGGGRWVSYPGSDIYFTSLGDLELALAESGNAILELIIPETGDEEGAVQDLAEEAAREAADDIMPVPEVAPDIPWGWIGLGAVALWLVGTR